MSKNSQNDRPNFHELETALRKERFARRYRNVLLSTVYSLVIVAAAAVLVATLWLPVLKIYGNSMTPTLEDGEIVIAFKTGNLQQGDMIAFYSGNKILVKRVIAQPGEWVDIDNEGNVYVNDALLEERYVTGKALGICNIEFPFQVTEGSLFVLGDHRETSVDSRSSAVGCVRDEQIVGEIVFRIWPLGRFSRIRQGG